MLVSVVAAAAISTIGSVAAVGTCLVCTKRRSRVSTSDKSVDQEPLINQSDTSIDPAKTYGTEVTSLESNKVSNQEPLNDETVFTGKSADQTEAELPNSNLIEGSSDQVQNSSVEQNETLLKSPETIKADNSNLLASATNNNAIGLENRDNFVVTGLHDYSETTPKALKEEEPVKASEANEVVEDLGHKAPAHAQTSNTQPSTTPSTPSLIEEILPIVDSGISPRSSSPAKSSSTITPALSPEVPHKETPVISRAKEEPLTPENTSKRHSRASSKSKRKAKGKDRNKRKI